MLCNGTGLYQTVSDLSFYAHGKLLLTSEYFVMDGAKAIALPTKLGQKMDVRSCHSDKPNLKWISLTPNGEPWMSATFDLNNFETKDSEHIVLQNILRQARKLNPEFLKEEQSVEVTTKLEFEKDWGLGSSSTLIHMIAQWADINPFELLNNTFGGSGYDIACAGAQGNILYQKPNWQTVDFKPSFTDNLYFVHLNRKQDSRDAITHYQKMKPDHSSVINDLNHLTDKILNAADLQSFETCIQNHEDIISNALKLTRTKDLYFSDYWGEIKSLGAWGGDFVLATSDRLTQETSDYFIKSGYKTCLKYNDLIL